MERLELDDGSIDLMNVTFSGGNPVYVLDASVDAVKVDAALEQLSDFEFETLSVENELGYNQVLKNIADFSYIEAIRQDPSSVTINAPSVSAFHKFRGKFLGKKFGKYTAYKLVHDDTLNTRDIYKYDVLETGQDTSSYTEVISGAIKVTTNFTQRFHNKIGDITITDVFLNNTHIATFKEGTYSYFKSGTVANSGVRYNVNRNK